MKPNRLFTKCKEMLSNKNLSLPKNVKIFEVGPRDGLQNEKEILEVNFKTKMIEGLINSGIKYIEAGAFVSPKWVPQMNNSNLVLENIYTKIKHEDIILSVLVPNLKGMQNAINSTAKEVAVFTAASEVFCKKNINCSIEESLQRFEEVTKLASKNNIKVRGYVSCVMGCPYSGEVSPGKVREVSEKLLEIGCYEISLGDTIGIGTPAATHELFKAFEGFNKNKLAVHFHDTGNMALENILVALEYGIGVIDSSVGGLGGCPYAQKSVGNVCTENVVYMLQELLSKH